MTLHPVLGHDDLRGALARAHRRGTLPASLLFHGPGGVGKQRLALWLAQLDLCEAPGADGPCDRCRSCRLSLRLEHPDVHWYFPLPRPKGASSPDKMSDALEEARFARLTELREDPLQPSVSDAPTGIYLAAARALRRRAQNRPSMADRQTFIIGDAETLVPQEASPEAANALLKLLEEPPRDTRFILTSSEPGSLLDTIRSRTVPVVVSPLPVATVAGFLTDRGFDPEHTDKAARLARGSVGRALGFLPQDDGSDGPLEEERRAAFQLLRAALSDRLGPAFQAALGYRVSGARGLLGLLSSLEVWLRDLAAVTAGESERVINRDAVPWMTRQARERRLAPEAVTRTLARVDDAAIQARGNVNPQLLVVGLLTDLRAILAPADVEVGSRG